MKIFITLVAVALLIVAAIMYFGSGDLSIAPKPTPGAAAATPRPDFTALTALLEKDMDQIPLALDAPRVAPASAFSVKSRLGNGAPARQEYQVLSQVSELIIFADQEHSVRQLKDKQEQANVFSDLMTSAGAQQVSTTSKRAAIHAKAQTDWGAYRQQTNTEVKRLLTSLPNAKS